MDSSLLIFMCEEGDISDEEFQDLVRISKADYKLLRCRRVFDLDLYSPEECLKSFRFSHAHLELLCEELRFPAHFFADNKCCMSGMDSLCLLLRRLAYPNRLHDLENEFGKDGTVLSRLFNQALDHVYDKFDHLLSRIDLNWISEVELEKWAHATTTKGSPYTSCVGFIDGTNIEICRPGEYEVQKLCYSGYTRRHDLKYFAVMTACGIMIGVYGPYPGSFHDARMLYESQLCNEVEASAQWNTPNMVPYHLYGDQGYKSTPQLMSPFRYNLTPQQALCNKTMSMCRIVVEWCFGKITQLFAFTQFPDNQKLGLQPLGKYYRVSALLANCHTCLNGSAVTDYFQCGATSLHAYLNG